MLGGRTRAEGLLIFSRSRRVRGRSRDMPGFSEWSRPYGITVVPIVCEPVPMDLVPRMELMERVLMV